MSRVAVFSLYCCSRLVCWGRYSGKLTSTSGHYPQPWCELCDPTREKMPRSEAYTSTGAFVGYTFDDCLEAPFYFPKRTRYLTRWETWRFLRNDLAARARLERSPLPLDQLPGVAWDDSRGPEKGDYPHGK